MAVKYRGFTNNKKASGTTVAITLPSGTASGDFAVILACANNTSVAWTTPTGWSLLSESTHSNEQGGVHSWAIFTRKLTGTTDENLPTLTASISAQLEYSVMVAETGSYNTESPVDTHSAGWQESSSTSELTVTMKGGTATLAGDLLFFFLSESQTPTTNPTGFTKDFEGTNTQGYHMLEAESGTITVGVIKNSKVPYNGFVVAIKAIAGITLSPPTASATASGPTPSDSITLTAPVGNTQGEGEIPVLLFSTAPTTGQLTASGPSSSLFLSTSPPNGLVTASTGQAVLEYILGAPNAAASASAATPVIGFSPVPPSASAKASGPTPLLAFLISATRGEALAFGPPPTLSEHETLSLQATTALATALSGTQALWFSFSPPTAGSVAKGSPPISETILQAVVATVTGTGQVPATLFQLSPLTSSALANGSVPLPFMITLPPDAGSIASASPPTIQAQNEQLPKHPPLPIINDYLVDLPVLILTQRGKVINELDVYEGKILPRGDEADVFSYQFTDFPISVNKPRQQTIEIEV